MKFEINYRWLDEDGMVINCPLASSIIPRVGENVEFLACGHEKEGIVASVTTTVKENFEKVLVVLK